MGRIFSYEEIVGGQLPEPSMFDESKNHFVELTTEGVRDGWLDGAFIYGSVALGLANVRSDFDAFLALSDINTGAYGSARSLITTIQDSTDGKIPLTPIVQPRRALEAGRHEMDRFFGQHLSSRFRIIIGNDPAKYIAYPEIPAGDILAGYLFQKKRKLTNFYTSVSPLDFREGSGVQRMLELPSAVGRKILQALAEGGYIEKAVDKSADKTAVLSQTRQLLYEEGIDQTFDEIVHLDQFYNDLLTETSSGNVTRAEYDDEIKALHSKLPIAITWIDRLEQILLPKL